MGTGRILFRALSVQATNTMLGNSFRELVSLLGRKQGIFAPGEVVRISGATLMTVCNWPGQGCWRIFHLHTQGLGILVRHYNVKQGMKSVNCQDNNSY